MIFRNWVLNNFPFLEDDFDALTDYELFCKMVEYMKKSLDKIKDYQEELNEFRTELDEYKNYFDNLDIQEEIDKKLDEMAESGELTDIIAQYLQLAGVLAYNTISDMSEATNIVNGSICKCLGNTTYNDGNGGYYKVRTITSSDVIDGVNLVSLDVSDTLVAEKMKNNKTLYFTPESFGAKGDGTTDDTTAIKNMFTYIDSIVPNKIIPDATTTTKDYEYVTIQWTGLYGISSEIAIQKTTGLKLINMKLIALSDFEDDDMLRFYNETRDLTLDNCILNGDLNVKNCITIEDYSLVTRIVNSWITRFTEKGIYGSTGKGHELIVDNTKINQVEWDERNDLSDLVDYGDGIYLSTQRYDNHFTNLIINYCRDNAVNIYQSSANFFDTCHFYWTGVLCNGEKNYFSNCYFDGVPLKTKGFIYVRNCYFGSDTGSPFIRIIGTYSDLWKYQLSHFIGNFFENKGTVGSITNSLVFDDNTWSSHESEFGIELLGNNFYDCPKLQYRSPHFYAPDPFKTNIYTGDATSGSVRIGDTLIQYGVINQTQASSDYITFPTAYTEYVIAVYLIKLDGNSTSPFANDISNSRFWANGVSGDVKWVAIGRMLP